jgi:exodeoxyribonuclease V alpha subunit
MPELQSPPVSRAQRFGTRPVAPAQSRGGANPAAAPSPTASTVPSAGGATAPSPAPAASRPAPAASRAARFGTPPRASAPSTAAPAEPLDSFIGVLDNLNVYNAWGLGSAWSEERKTVKITGEALVDLVVGAEYEFRGRTSFSAKHGESFQVEIAAPYVRANRKSIEKFLVRNFKGVGDKKAAQFVDSRLAGLETEQQKGAALEQLRQQLLTSPWTLDLTGVAKQAEFQNDEQSSPLLAFLHRDLQTRLTGIPGMRDSVLKTIASHLLQAEARSRAEGAAGEGQSSNLDPRVLERCWARLVTDPYEPIRDIDGYGFAMADAIGALVNIPRDAPQRLRALVLHALTEGCTRSGHVYLTHKQLAGAIRDVDGQVPIARAIEVGVADDFIELDEEFGEPRYYPPAHLACEISLASRVADLVAESAPMTKAPPEKVRSKIAEVTRQVAPHMVGGLDPSQLEAMVGLLTSRQRLHTLTAGPGCGKTALMEILTCVLKSREFVFCGPTGKSAKVLNNRLSRHGRSAATAHSTLQGSCRKDFQVNADHPLEGDVLVMDETGMSDIDLADGLLAAVNEKMHVILLGDDKQLPSVSPGQFLKDMLALKAPDHHRLSTTHRNGGGILDVVNQVGEGYIDCIDRDDVWFSHGLGEAADEFPQVAANYVDAVRRLGFENVILLIPRRKGKEDTPGWNTTYANAVLRQMCNPNAEKIPGTGKMHVGDRIIVRANMSVPLAGQSRADAETWEVKVVNGDTGTIVGWVPYQQKQNGPKRAGAQFITLELDDGRRVDFPGTVNEALQHSYALSVHSGQGSEYEHVIFVGGKASRSFMNRPMLFTALSRARGKLEIHAEDSDLRNMASTPGSPRNSALAQRVRRLLGEPDAQVISDDDFEIDDLEDNSDAVGKPVPVHQQSARARRFSSVEG